MSRFALYVEAAQKLAETSASSERDIHYTVGCFRLDFEVGSLNVIEVLVEELGMSVLPNAAEINISHRLPA